MAFTFTRSFGGTIMPHPPQLSPLSGASGQGGRASLYAVEAALDVVNNKHDLNLPLALQRGFGHCQMGLYLRVIEAGEVAAGDPLEVVA